jgi:hypothetical protein
MDDASDEFYVGMILKMAKQFAPVCRLACMWSPIWETVVVALHFYG